MCLPPALPGHFLRLLPSLDPLQRLDDLRFRVSDPAHRVPLSCVSALIPVWPEGGGQVTIFQAASTALKAVDFLQELRVQKTKADALEASVCYGRNSEG